MYQNTYLPVLTLQDAPVKTGGFCSLKIFKWEDVLTWPGINPQTGILDNTVVLKPGAVIYVCPLIDDTRFFEEEEKQDEAGPFFSIIVKGLVPGSNVSNILSLGTMMFHQWGIIAPDRNGVTRLIGNEDGGAKLSLKYGSGDPNSSRKTEVIFSWEHPIPAPIYTAEAFTIIIGGLMLTAGCLTLLKQFKVGAPGAPMIGGDTTLTDAGFANKRLLVLADGIALPVDYGDGAIDWSASIDRHTEKPLAGSTTTFVGAVRNDETIEVYAWT